MHYDVLITNMSIRVYKNASLSNEAKNKNDLKSAIFLTFGLTDLSDTICIGLK
jgi:hypothetical protein